MANLKKTSLAGNNTNSSTPSEIQKFITPSAAEPLPEDKDITNDSKIAITIYSILASKLEEVIEAVYTLPESYKQSLVRMSKEEVDMINSFIDDNFNTRLYRNNSVSLTKLMRYCTTFLLKNYPKELKQAINNTLKKEAKEGIFS